MNSITDNKIDLRIKSSITRKNSNSHLEQGKESETYQPNSQETRPVTPPVSVDQLHVVERDLENQVLEDRGSDNKVTKSLGSNSGLKGIKLNEKALIQRIGEIKYL